MRGNGNVIGPRNRGISGVWHPDDQARGGVYIPVTEDAANDDTYVCAFTGGANETGVGGGLTGADLVLTPFGTVPAAVDGYRAVTHPNGFAATAALWGVLGGQPTGTLMMLLKEWAPRVDGAGGIAELSYTPDGVTAGQIFQIRTNANAAGFSDGGHNVYWHKTSSSVSQPQLALGIPYESYSGWLCWTTDGTYTALGFKRSLQPPTRWEEFDSIIAIKHAVTYGGLSAGQILGSQYYGASFKVGRLVVSKLAMDIPDFENL